MDPTVEEAIRAKEHAEKLFLVNDFAGAKQYALRAQSLCPQLEGISQMVATFEIYSATEININREVDFYSVLGLDPSSDKSLLKKRYKKMAVLLHPDKNKTVGADEAFKLVSEAWAVLSDNVKRSSYDSKRNKHLLAAAYNNSGVSGSESSSRLDTFWTVCTSCRVQYEYLRKYVNKRLSCKNCRGVFVAVETGAAPVTYTPWSYTSENGYANHSYNTGTYVPNTSVCFTRNGSAAVHPTHGYEYAETVSFQWNTSDPNGLPSKAVNVSRSKANGKHQTKLNTPPGEFQAPKMGRPPKKRKIEMADGTRNTNGEAGLRTEPDSVVTNDIPLPPRQYLVAPAFDARKLLINKARSVIRSKLKEMKLASAVKAEKTVKSLNKSSSMAITVPDPDFHDFDMDRSEEVFKPKQIWAIYDEEDGMPRLYCLIRQVISVKPFQLHITYLNSKPDTEFGYNKSCGSFKVSHSHFVDQVNIFSHLLGREKTGRGGCVNIYPKRGDIWAVYRNWSESWSKKTSKKVRQQYEMVEILDDYAEKLGVCVTPLVKLEGYKTVYQRNPNKNAVRLIPRKEMVRFSHQVPSCLLKGQGLNLPDGCWDLDPAATPEQLLQADAEDEEEKNVEVTANTEGVSFIKYDDAYDIESIVENLCNLFGEILKIVGVDNIVHMVTDNAANYKSIDDKPSLSYVYEVMSRAKQDIEKLFCKKRDLFESYTNIIDNWWDKMLRKILHVVAYWLNPIFLFDAINFKDDDEVMVGVLDMDEKTNNRYKLKMQLNKFYEAGGSFSQQMNFAAHKTMCPDKITSFFYIDL